MLLLIGANLLNSKSAVGRTVGNIIEPEFKATVGIKSIVKFELPKNVKGDFSTAEFLGLFGGRNARERIAVERRSGQAHGWWQFESAHYFLLRRNEDRVKREFVDFNIYPIRHPISWRLTTIFEPETELRRERELRRGSVIIADRCGFFDGDISTQLPFGRLSSVTQLAENNPYKGNRSYREQTREYGKWIIDRLLDKPGYMSIISVFFGLLCCASGIALYLKDFGRLLSVGALALVGLGILTPLIPWWILILWLAVCE